MLIQLDLDPRDVWRIQQTAAEQGITPGDVVRSELSAHRTRNQLDAIAERVRSGMCDADIGDELGMPVGAVASQRRGLRLPANPHPVRGKNRMPAKPDAA